MDTKGVSILIASLTVLLVVHVPSDAQTPSSQITQNVPLKLSDEEGTTEEVLYLWDALWYLRGTGVFEPLGNVDGGVIGSSAFAVPNFSSNPPSCDWYFVEGSYVFLKSRATSATRYFVKDRGYYRNCANGVCGTPIQADGLLLSVHLKNIYHRSRGFRVGRHTPFFNRGDWDTTFSGPQNASLANVLDYAEKMDFEVAFLPDRNGVVNQQGRVVSQKPQPGTLLPRKGVVAVELDGTTITVVTPVKLDDVEIELVGADPGKNILSDSGQERLVQISPERTDYFKSSKCSGGGKEQVFLLPAEAVGQEVTVSTALGTEGEVVLSAWYVADSGKDEFVDNELVDCIRGVGPVLTFVANPPEVNGKKAGVYVVAEAVGRESDEFFIRMHWLPPVEESESDQSE